MSPRSLYKALALAEAVTWTLLILGMIGKYGFGIDAATLVGGSLHGFAFLCYVVATVAVWTDRRWSTGWGVLGLGSAIVPYATIPFERAADRRGMLPDTWRLADGEPSGPLDRLLAFAIRRPVLATVVTLLVVSVVFLLLLQAGPPTEWFS